MMKDIFDKQIAELNGKLSGPVKISLLQSDDHRYDAMKAFCEQLQDRVPKIQIISKDAETGELPAIDLGKGIRYSAVPSEHELAPFLEAIVVTDRGARILPDTLNNRLHEIKLPATLQAYVAPQCTFCPRTIRDLIPLVIANDLVRLIVIDSILFPERVEEFKIQAVPTVILDDQFRWTGNVEIEEIINVAITRDPSSLGVSSLVLMLQEGNASQLAQMMLDKNTIFPAFYDLLAHEKWPVRMGAMVTMEEFADSGPELAAQAVDPLWNRFQVASDQTKGDLLYILGIIGHPSTIPLLESVLKGEYNEDVKEAAKEALQTIG